MDTLSLFTLILCTTFHHALALLGDLEYDGRLNIRLEHTFDATGKDQFTHRGDINVKSLHSGLTYIDQVQLSNQQIKALRELSSKNQLYRLRATVKTHDDQQFTFLTFVKACALVSSRLTDTISVSLDHLGNAVAITLTTPNACSSSSDIDDSNLLNFNTTVYIRHMELGPIPDTATYIQKLEKEREAKERGDSKDNKSFLGKYWMYIVPVLIFILLSSATNPEAGGGQR